MNDIYTFFLIGNDECDVKNSTPGAMTEEHQIAGLNLFQRYFYPFEGLCTGARREGDIEVLHYKVGKTGTVEAYFGITAGIAIRQPQVFLGIFYNRFSELPLPLNIRRNHTRGKHGTGLKSEDPEQQ